MGAAVTGMRDTSARAYSARHRPLAPGCRVGAHLNRSRPTRPGARALSPGQRHRANSPDLFASTGLSAPPAYRTGNWLRPLRRLLSGAGRAAEGLGDGLRSACDRRPVR